MSVVGDEDGLFLPIYPPRSMRVVLGFWWLVDFHNKYVSSLWLMLIPWIIRTLTLPSLLASSVPCIALSHLESWCKLRQCIQTLRYDTLHHTQTSLYLPQNSHHTYLLWHFHSHSEIYCIATSIIIIMTSFTFVILLFAWWCSWHRICGKATFIIFIHVTLDSLHIPAHRRRHSYRVIPCSSIEL